MATAHRKLARRVMPYHEVTDIFPMMSEEEFKALTEDIRANGQREPIWTYQGKIIDGRNRYSAILRLQEQKVNIEPTFREWDGQGSLVAFVVSLNLHRRHLDVSQRAMVAATLANQKRGGDRGNQHTGGKAQICAMPQEEAASLLNVSRRAVQSAAKVQQHGDKELITAVQSGEVTVSAAAKAIDAAERYPQVAAIIPKSKAEEIVKIAKNLDALPEPIREEKIQKLVKNDLPTLREMTDRAAVPAEPKSPAKTWAEWVLDARIRLGKVRNESFRNGILLNWTDADKEMVLEAIDLLTEDLATFRTDVIGGLPDDERTEEGAEGTVN